MMDSQFVPMKSALSLLRRSSCIVSRDTWCGRFVSFIWKAIVLKVLKRSAWRSKHHNRVQWFLSFALSLHLFVFSSLPLSFHPSGAVLRQSRVGIAGESSATRIRH